MLGALPLALWLPYTLYRESHLRHHRHEGRYLTDIDRDPESFYWSVAATKEHGRVMRAIARFHGTLVGRLLLGPALCLGRFCTCEISKVYRGLGSRRILWLRHALGVLAVCAWLNAVCHILL